MMNIFASTGLARERAGLDASVLLALLYLSYASSDTCGFLPSLSGPVSVCVFESRLGVALLSGWSMNYSSISIKSGCCLFSF